MRDISEYKLLGNYLVRLYEKYGIDSINYEQAQSFTKTIFTNINKINANYKLLPIDKKNDIIKSMINKGVFRTNTANRSMPFKQVYNYEISKYINAVYTCDKNLTFKILHINQPGTNNSTIVYMQSMYCKDIGLELQNEIKNVISLYRPNTKNKVK